MKLQFLKPYLSWPLLAKGALALAGAGVMLMLS